MSPLRDGDDVRMASGSADVSAPLLLLRVATASAWLSSCVSGLIFFLMTGLVITQVVFRYILSAPLTGSEEAARIAMIYVVLIGSALCLRHGGHMAVTYFRDRLPRNAALLAHGAVVLGTLIFALILIVKGAEFAQRSTFMTTPALQLPRSYIVWAFPLGGVLMVMFTAELGLRHLLGLHLDNQKETDL